MMRALPIIFKRTRKILVRLTVSCGAGESVVCNYRPATEAELTRCAAVEAVLAKHDVPLGAASLQFPLGHPIVSSGTQDSRP